MSTITLPAHYDGHQILLGAPYPIEPNARLNVVILSETAEDEERADWARLGLQNFAAAYGDDETEYTLDMIKEWNPEYEGR